MWQNIGYILIGLGVLGLAGWALWGFFASSEVPVLIRIALGVVGVGVLMLLGIAIKDRIRRRDKHEEADYDNHDN